MSGIFGDEPYIPKAKDARKKKKGFLFVASVFIVYGCVGYWWYEDGSWWLTHWFVDNVHIKFGGVDISPKNIPHL